MRLKSMEPGGCGKDWFWCEASDYFRIKFTPSENDDIPLDSFLSFETLLPLARPPNGTRRVHSYILIAAGRERAAPNEPGRIRLFRPDGSDLFPVAEEEYSDGGWKVGAPGHTYNLYYMRTHQVFDLPTSEDRALMRETWRQMKAEENAKDSPETFLQQAMGKMAQNAQSAGTQHGSQYGDSESAGVNSTLGETQLMMSRELKRIAEGDPDDPSAYAWAIKRVKHDADVGQHMMDVDSGPAGPNLLRGKTHSRSE